MDTAAMNIVSCKANFYNHIIGMVMWLVCQVFARCFGWTPPIGWIPYLVWWKTPNKVWECINSILSIEFAEAHLRGGCIRNLLWGCSPRDWDIFSNVPSPILHQIIGGELVNSLLIKMGRIDIVSNGRQLEEFSAEFSKFEAWNKGEYIFVGFTAKTYLDAKSRVYTGVANEAYIDKLQKAYPFILVGELEPEYTTDGNYGPNEVRIDHPANQNFWIALERVASKWEWLNSQLLCGDSTLCLWVESPPFLSIYGVY